MSKENGFVPIDEASTDKIRFSVDLPPFLDRTRIRANPGRIESLMRIGGISHLRVETVEGDRVQESPIVVGFDSQGNAYAGKVGAKTETKTQEYEMDNSQGKRRVAPTASVSVKLDVVQISQEIVNEGVGSPSAWAKKMDKRISEGVRNAGSRVLLIENLKYDTLGPAYQAFMVSGDMAMGVDPVLMAARFASFTAVLHLIGSVVGRDRRISAFMGSQVDRAALLQVRSRLQEVVKASSTK